MNKQEAKTTFLFFVFTFICILTFLFLMGCMTDRGQFVDDHETVTWVIDGAPSIISIFKNDLQIGRFRPLYILFRICKKLIFGENFFLWHLWHAFLTAIVGTLVFALARLFKLGIIPSILLSGLCLIGPQSEVWYRLGPQEIEGALFFVLALIASHLWLKPASVNTKPGTHTAWCACSILSAVLSTWCKESFAVSVPVLMTYIILMDTESDSGSGKYLSRFVHSVRHTLAFHIVLFLITLANGYIVIKKTGLLGIGYAGVDTQSGFSAYIYGTLQIFTSDWIPFLLLLVGLIFCLVQQITTHKLLNGWLIIPSVLLVLSQLFIYNKSGMFGRYYLPLVFSLVFVWAVVFKNIHSIIITALPILYLLFCFFTYCISGAKDYAYNDKGSWALMDFIESNLESNSVIVIDHWAYEICHSIEQYATHDGFQGYFFGIDENADCYPLNDYAIDAPWDKKYSDYIITDIPYDDTPSGFYKIWEGDKWIVYQHKH